MKEIKIEDSIIAKGIYARPQNSGYMSLKQFIIMELHGKKCLLLRYENEAAFEITQSEFILKQLDSKGEVIDVATLKYKKIAVYPGQTFAPREGVTLKDECFDFIIQPVSLVGGKYLYKFDNDVVTAHYDRRGYGERMAYKKNKEENSVTVSRRYSGDGGGFNRKIAFVSLLLVTVFLAIILCYHMFYAEIWGAFDSLFDGFAADTEIVAPDAYPPEGWMEDWTFIDTEEPTGTATQESPEFTFELPPLRPVQTT